MRQRKCVSGRHMAVRRSLREGVSTSRTLSCDSKQMHNPFCFENKRVETIEKCIYFWDSCDRRRISRRLIHFKSCHLFFACQFNVMQMPSNRILMDRSKSIFETHFHFHSSNPFNLLQFFSIVFFVRRSYSF